ncbi:MAG: TetR/AcrR family transcriptional regulator [Bacteroidia bacterium]|nr:TetR/AcrR family transcriptional regulator [Bacteroidia bacterium]
MSPRSAAKNEEIRRETIRKIMDSAFLLISKQGYESTSIAQIAKEADISKGLLYNYFKSKEDLLENLIKAALVQGDQIMSSILTEDPATTLENLFRWFFKELRERPDYWRMINELAFKADKFKFVQDIAVEKWTGYTNLLQKLFEQMGFENSAEEAMIAAALFDGIGIQSVVLKKDYPLSELERILIDKYCKRKK